jgi:hypothetical protein
VEVGRTRGEKQVGEDANQESTRDAAKLIIAKHLELCQSRKTNVSTECKVDGKKELRALQRRERDDWIMRQGTEDKYLLLNTWHIVQSM